MERRTRGRWDSYLVLLLLSTVYLQVFSLSTVSVLEPSKPPIGQHVCSTLAQSQEKCIPLFSSQYEDENYAETLEDDADDSFMASPLSQLRSDADEVYRGTFSRDEKWLEQATEEVLGFEVGTLSEDDVESITGLMAAWVRRRSVSAALAVEKLLKRVVDDMRAHNPDAHVTARMYTIAIDAWAKSGNSMGAERAQNIHDGMIDLYRNTGDPRLAPSSISYNTVMNAWCKSGDKSAPARGEKLLEEMLEWNSESVRPDAVTFSTLLDTYARINPANATHNAERIFDMMDDLQIKRNVFTFSALQNVYARSGKADAPEKTMKVLQRMLDLYSKGDMFAKPNAVNFNAVLNAYSRTATRKSAELADELLSNMELPVEDGGFDVEPGRLSYALTILACSRCPDLSLAPRLSERNLEKMEKRALLEAKKREEVSSAAPPAVTIDIECFNVVLTAISKCGQNDSVSRTIRIVKRMEQYAKQGKEQIRPNKRSWNAVMNAISRSGEKDMAERAEQILNHMFKLHAQGVPGVQPDAFSFAAVLSAYQRQGTAHAVQRADDILRQMEKLHEAGQIDFLPDVYHYTIVCASWAKSKQKQATDRCVQILTHMKQRAAAGHHGVRPNVRTYNAVLDCMARSNQEDKAEQLLYHMLDLGQNGDRGAFPDSFSFNSVINAFARSRKRDAGMRAESVLDRFLEYSEDHPSLRPDVRSFTFIISYYGKNYERPDAPYRAEYVLNRLVSMFKNGHKYLSPSVFSITMVMDTYSKHKHPDAGECAERLLRLLKKLRDFYGASKLEVNTGVMNSVLNAWASCGGDDAGRRADLVLRDMEEQFDLGDETVKPNARCYCLVLTAWSKSGSSDKAEKALEVVERMKRRYEEGKLQSKPGEHVYSLVINTCAFTRGAHPDAEMTAFKIAVKSFKEMVESDHMEPVSVTYGWFIQACGRLRVPTEVKEENIERAFIRCCDKGYVNEFVLSCLRGAASESLLTRLMSRAGAKVRNIERDKDGKQRIGVGHLPKDWTRSRHVPRYKKPIP